MIRKLLGYDFKIANRFFLFAIYFIINLLFLTKYGARQNFIPLSILIIVFGIFHFLLLILFNKFSNKNCSLSLLISLISVFTIAYIVGCHIYSNPIAINIDRWQTLYFSLKNWLHGVYFYDIINFMGNKSSYLPGQLLLALPSYVLGNIGYIQVFAFLTFAISSLYYFSKKMVTILAIIAFGCSISNLYEVICKSDFISSFVFVSSFILVWSKKYKNNYFERPILLGMLVGVLCLTRSVAVLGLLIFLLKPFFRQSLKTRIQFLISFLSTVFILLVSVFITAPSLEYVKLHNPFSLQGQSSSSILMFLCVILSCILSFLVDKKQDVFYFSSYIIFFAMLSYMIEQYIRFDYGFQNNFFATTYLAACLPFVIVAFCFSFIKKE